MTLVEPIPDLQWGKASWQDYISNWRTRDTNWMQERVILRYQTSAQRTADWTSSPRAGQVTYNEETKSLEMWRATASAWVRSLMFQYLISTQDTATAVTIQHSGAGGKGLTFGTTSLQIDLPTTTFLGGVHTIDATGITVKVGTKTAKLSTDATNLVSDSPIKAPSLDLSGGTGTVINAAGKTVAVGVLNADSATIPNITMTGTLSGGGVINGASGTIASIGHAAGGILTTPAGSASANAAGLQSGQGYFYGDANSAIMRQRTSVGSAAGASYVKVLAASIDISATDINMMGSLRNLNARSVVYHNTTNTVAWNGGPVIYQASDPGVGNVPEGTIWLQ